LGEPLGCVPAVALPAPNLKKSRCPASHHDWSRDWKSRLLCLPRFPGRDPRAAKDTKWGWSLRDGVLHAAELVLCGCEMVCRTWGRIHALISVPASPPQERRVRHGREMRRVEKEGEGWKRRLKGGRGR